MRVFVPATMQLLARWRATGVIDVDTAFAVTPFLREFYASGDTEELEYAAQSDAARSSLLLLAGAPDAPRRRVVLALDAPSAQPDAGLGRSVVRLGERPSFDHVAAAHVDADGAEDAVGAAVVALLEFEDARGSRASSGGRSAQYAIEDLEAHELLWYASQEIPDLLAES